VHSSHCGACDGYCLWRSFALEDARAKAATLAAKKMASSFLLASPSPSAAECEVSLRATLDVLTRL
jgi:hypothetical protein